LRVIRQNLRQLTAGYLGYITAASSTEKAQRYWAEMRTFGALRMSSLASGYSHLSFVGKRDRFRDAPW